MVSEPKLLQVAKKVLLLIIDTSPARFYVSVIVKELLSQLLLDYDFMLVAPTARPFWTVGKVRLANPFMSLLVRRRIFGQPLADSRSLSV
jgi:hypothetical protein